VGVDDEDAVREAVEPDRVEVQRRDVARVAGKRPVWPLRGPSDAISRRMPTSSSSREIFGARVASSFTSASKRSFEMLRKARDGSARSSLRDHGRRSPRSRERKDGACAAETTATMASGRRSRPGIRMDWDDLVSS
jgi:hypothetical protein